MPSGQGSGVTEIVKSATNVSGVFLPASSWPTVATEVKSNSELVSESSGFTTVTSPVSLTAKGISLPSACRRFRRSARLSSYFVSAKDPSSLRGLGSWATMAPTSVASETGLYFSASHITITIAFVSQMPQVYSDVAVVASAVAVVVVAVVVVDVPHVVDIVNNSSHHGFVCPLVVGFCVVVVVVVVEVMLVMVVGVLVVATVVVVVVRVVGVDMVVLVVTVEVFEVVVVLGAAVVIVVGVSIVVMEVVDVVLVVEVLKVVVVLGAAVVVVVGALVVVVEMVVVVLVDVVDVGADDDAVLVLVVVEVVVVVVDVELNVGVAVVTVVVDDVIVTSEVAGVDSVAVVNSDAAEVVLLVAVIVDAGVLGVLVVAAAAVVTVVAPTVAPSLTLQTLLSFSQKHTASALHCGAACALHLARSTPSTPTGVVVVAATVVVATSPAAVGATAFVLHVLSILLYLHTALSRHSFGLSSLHLPAFSESPASGSNSVGAPPFALHEIESRS